MILHKPEITQECGELCVSARVELQNPNRDVPAELWYKFPESCQDYVTDRSDGFAASLLPLAMARGESLEVRGDVSATLAHGMHEYQLVQSTWQPRWFKTVNLQFESLINISNSGTRGKVGCAFSGGIDSFYTVWSHLPQNEPNPAYTLTHCLLINGFDANADLDNSGNYSRFQNAFEPALNDLGLELLISRTNLRQFLEFPIFRHSYGSMVTASALVLGRLFSCLYISSACSFAQMGLYQEGSHLMLDHLLHTETMETVHDAGNLTRIEKTAAIAQFPAAYKTLCVCWEPITFNPETGIPENCCKCTKCMRTMISLDLYGSLGKFKTFPEPIDDQNLRRSDHRKMGTTLFAWEIVNLAKEKKNWPVVFNLVYAMTRSFVIGQILLLGVYIRRHSKWCRKILGEEKVTRIYRWLFKSY
jgi:hypothetical protein